MIPVRQSIGGLGNLMFKQAYLVGQMLEGKIPDMYVQSNKYWKDHEGVIKELFSQNIIGGEVDYSPMVSLQIRRGDYVGNDFYVDLAKTDYYKKATDLFPKSRFLVFCQDRQNEERDLEDKQWCRDFLNEIIPGRFEMWPGISDTDDLNKMASCVHNIIANSSFGWWAGFLNPNPRKTVVTPKSWFTDGVQRCDLIDSWVQL